jgi:hypothetical protein
MSLAKQLGPTRREPLFDGLAVKIRRVASYWPMALIGLSAAATVLWVGILALLIRAFWEAI